MRENFNKSFDFLMKLEGYISDDKNDIGGYTKYGISQKYHPYVNVPQLTLEQAKKIYLDEYWILAECDELGYPFDMCLFIQSVNLGVSRACKFLGDSNGLLDFFMKNLQHYATRPKVQRDVFLTGWCNRLIKLWEAV